MTVPTTMSPTDAATLVRGILDELERAVVGKRAELELVMAAMLAGGHVLLDDVPGVAKTLTARSIATTLGLDFARIQFTPDLLPGDITGGNMFDLVEKRPEFHPGPLFAQLVLADEINRAPAKTQSALLEAMQESQVTTDGVTHPLPQPFFVIATENPIDSEGTYPLPEAQLDRFLIRARLGYPAVGDEIELINRRIERGTEQPTLRQVAAPTDVSALRRTVETVHVDPAIVAYVVTIADHSRRHRELTLGISPRGTLSCIRLARAKALLGERDFVTPDDVRAATTAAFAHRVVLSDEAWARGTQSESVVRDLVDSVPTPSWQEPSPR